MPFHGRGATRFSFNHPPQEERKMATPSEFSPVRSAVLDEAHLGDITGAFGTIAHHDTAPRTNWWARFRTLMAILGPGLIVMVGDNDAGAFATYTQAGQNYGTTLLWTLLLLVPVLYVNQEMVLRLGAVTGVGHARLIFERFGKFWGAFSIIDLFILNALTIVTEFIGITFVVDFFGVSRLMGVGIAAALTMAAVSTGNFRRFERFAMALCMLSLLLVPVLVSIHPPLDQTARDLLIPNWPGHSKLADVMLLVIGIVGTTVAPWQLFFQQSYVVDKRITPRFIKYERADLWIGIVFVMIGAIAMMAFCAELFAGRPESGNFTDAGGVIAGLEKYAGRTMAAFFAVALLDASIIGAAAVSLSTAYAIGDVFKIRHSLHRSVSTAKGFYLVYFGIVAAAATLVLIPGSPLGLLTEAVQTLAGILLPSATVFLLLLCNDKAVLGPWVNSRKVNLFTGAVIWVLVMLSIILTASVIYPDMSGETMLKVLVGGTVLAVAGYAAMLAIRGVRREPSDGSVEDVAHASSRQARDTWRMPPLEQLPAAKFTLTKLVWMGVLRGYLVLAVILLVVKVVQMMFFK
jgi:NRAMP (natural resistance-associated macrophage protein)-like metal ion transporter